MTKSILMLSTLGLALSLALPGRAASVVPPEPTEDKLMLTAGFLSAHPDLDYRIHGTTAYREGRHDDAMRLFRRAAYFADKPSQGMIAEMYWNGQGVERDPALAYVWMDLAAERGYAGFLGLRERYWNALDAAQRERAISEGQTLYAQFGDAAAKLRFDHHLRRGRAKMVGSRTGFVGNVNIEVPGAGGSETINGSKFYDERYWDTEKYWAWQDRVWMKPLVGRVEVGDLEVVRDEAPAPAVQSRIPVTAPQVDAPIPDVPAETLREDPPSDDGH